MVFSEVYGSYFRVVAEVLGEAVAHRLTGERLREIVQEKAFAESVLTIPAALRENWPLLREDLTTPLHHAPSMPLTTLEKRWLKTLLQDPRIALFAPDAAGLADVEPLFRWEDVVYFDRYNDGDPYDDAVYVQNFRTTLQAIRQHRKVRFIYRDSHGRRRVACGVPNQMEYSEKDDKFRVLVKGKRAGHIFNMARIKRCELLETVDRGFYHAPNPRLRSITFRLRDERNALDRVLLHFSHLEKETVRLDDGEYEVTVRYDRDDETEMLIRMLSFGPVVQVTEPEDFIEKMRQRLQKQQLYAIKT